MMFQNQKENEQLLTIEDFKESQADTVELIKYLRAINFEITLNLKKDNPIEFRAVRGKDILTSTKNTEYRYFLNGEEVTQKEILSFTENSTIFRSGTYQISRRMLKYLSDKEISLDANKNIQELFSHSSKDDIRTILNHAEQLDLKYSNILPTSEENLKEDLVYLGFLCARAVDEIQKKQKIKQELNGSN